MNEILTLDQKIAQIEKTIEGEENIVKSYGKGVMPCTEKSLENNKQLLAWLKEYREMKNAETALLN